MAKDEDVLRYLVSSSGKLLESGKYSDMTIRCRDRVFHVHRSMLCTRSEFFEKAMDTGFLEGQTREINLGQDESEDGLYVDEPHIVEAMLKFLYTGDYDDGLEQAQKDAEWDGENSFLVNSGGWIAWDFPSDNPFVPTWKEQTRVAPYWDAVTNEIAEGPTQKPVNWPIEENSAANEVPVTESSDKEDKPFEEPPGNNNTKHSDRTESPFLFNAKVYLLAKKYFIGQLQVVASDKLALIPLINWNNQSPRYHPDFVLGFMKSADLIYGNTSDSDDRMRHCISKIAENNLNFLMARESWCELMRVHGDLGVDILQWKLLSKW